MDGFRENTCLIADFVEHHVPFRGIEPRSGNHRRGNGQAVGGEDRDQSGGQVETGDGARGGRAQILGQSLAAFGDPLHRPHRQGTARRGSAARDQVDQLAPLDRAGARIIGALIENGRQAIVELQSLTPSRAKNPCLSSVYLAGPAARRRSPLSIPFRDNEKGASWHADAPL